MNNCYTLLPGRIVPGIDVSSPQRRWSSGTIHLGDNFPLHILGDVQGALLQRAALCEAEDRSRPEVWAVDELIGDEPVLVRAKTWTGKIEAPLPGVFRWGRFTPQGRGVTVLGYGQEHRAHHGFVDVLFALEVGESMKLRTSQGEVVVTNDGLYGVRLS